MQVISFQNSPIETTTTTQTKELLVSPSQLKAWKECPKKHDYVYHKNLKPKARKVFFDKGNYTHEIMHVLYHTMQNSGLPPGNETLVASIIARIRNDVRLHTTALNAEIYNSVMKLMTRYITVQSPNIDRGIRVRGVEHELRFPTGKYTPDGREIVLFGFVDLIYRTLRGDYVIRDHKTGSNPRRWNRDTVEADFQLLCYGSWFWQLHGVVPKVEVNFCNTYKYKKGPSDSQFALYSHSHTEEVYKNFYSETLQLIEDMLNSGPTPHYGEGCVSCSFREPCFLERKGVSVGKTIEANYEIVDRSGSIRPTPFTQDNADGN